jgi:hypothetical protein
MDEPDIGKTIQVMSPERTIQGQPDPMAIDGNWRPSLRGDSRPEIGHEGMHKAAGRPKQDRDCDDEGEAAMQTIELLFHLSCLLKKR